MSDARQPPQRQVPTLTEVVADASEDEAPQAPVDAESTEVDGSALVERVLFDVQRQIDLMLEQRLREMLAPAVTRLAEGLIAESREQLAHVLHELVERAVAQELARRGRS